MSGKHGPKDPDVRAAFLAALEYGVNPLSRANYSREAAPYTREEERADAVIADRAYARHVRSGLKPRRLVQTAAQILAEVDR